MQAHRLVAVQPALELSHAVSHAVSHRYSGRTSARWSNLLWQPGQRRCRDLPMASMQCEQKACPHLITRSFCRRLLHTCQARATCQSPMARRDISHLHSEIITVLPTPLHG